MYVNCVRWGPSSDKRQPTWMWAGEHRQHNTGSNFKPPAFSPFLQMSSANAFSFYAADVLKWGNSAVIVALLLTSTKKKKLFLRRASFHWSSSSSFLTCSTWPKSISRAVHGCPCPEGESCHFRSHLSAKETRVGCARARQRSVKTKWATWNSRRLILATCPGSPVGHFTSLYNQWREAVPEATQPTGHWTNGLVRAPDLPPPLKDWA